MKGRLPRNYDKPQGTMVLGLDAVLMVAADREVDRSTLRPPEVALMDLVDGKKTIEEVLQHSQTSWFVAMRRLRSLCERGILVPTKTADDASAPGRKTAPDRAASSDEQRSRVTLDLTDVVNKLAPQPSPSPPEGVPGAPSAPPTAPGFTPMSAQRRETSKGQPSEPSLPGSAQQTSFVPTSPSLPAGAITKLHGVHAAALAPPSDDTVPPPAVQTAPPVVDPSEGGVVTTAAAPGGSGPVAGRGKRMKPFKLGRYEVVTRIGQGGMGSVYLCRQPGHWGFQRLFTLKVIREHAAGDREAMRSFLREARIGGLLSHPNILGVVDVGSYKGQPFLVMDYVEGASLSDLLVGPQPPAAPLLIPVLLDSLRGLQSAHEQVDARGTLLGIVHCDVSPHNIIVGLDGAARITDFGSARTSGDPTEGEHEELPAVGKPGYMAPEQLCGNPIDARTDVFAMGIVMWTALTGRKLFTDPSYEQTIINVLRKKVEPPSAFGAPPSLDEVCLKALSRAPDARYQSAEEMRLALHRVASREAMIASNAEISRWVKRTAGEALEERRRRILTAFGDPDEPTGASASDGAARPADPAGSAAGPVPTVAIPAPHSKTTIILPREALNRGRGGKTIRLPPAEATQTLNMQRPMMFDDLNRRRRAWMVIAAVAAGSALTILVAHALLSNDDRPVKRRPRSAATYTVPADADTTARKPSNPGQAGGEGTAGGATAGNQAGAAGERSSGARRSSTVTEVERRSPVPRAFPSGGGTRASSGSGAAGTVSPSPAQTTGAAPATGSNAAGTEPQPVSPAPTTAEPTPPPVPAPPPTGQQTPPAPAPAPTPAPSSQPAPTAPSGSANSPVPMNAIPITPPPLDTPGTVPATE